MANSEYNGWRVLHRFIEGLFDVINNRQIYPFSMLIIFLIIAAVVWKLPGDELADIIKLLINSPPIWVALILIVVITNLVWLYLFQRKTSIYNREIDRLTAIRRELMHNPSKNLIKRHRSTEDECEESYIIPPFNPIKKNLDESDKRIKRNEQRRT